MPVIIPLTLTRELKWMRGALCGCSVYNYTGSVHPMAIEYAADEATENVDLDDGESYISANGSKWVSVDTVEKSNLCIKAFSDNR